MFGLDKKDTRLLMVVALLTFCAPVLLNPFPAEACLAQFNAGYPDLMQRFVIFGIFAIGFNILFGLTGYLSFGHAAFLGVGSYSAVWMFKLLSYNVVPAIILSVITAGIFAVVIGYISLRRSGIYFSILTLAFAQMSYNLAYSVLTPITNGETGLQVYGNDPQYLKGNGPDVTHLFGFGNAFNRRNQLRRVDLRFFNRVLHVCDHHVDFVLPCDPRIPVTFRTYVARNQSKSNTLELYWYFTTSLYVGRVCYLGHVCWSCRWFVGRNGPIGRCRAYAVDRIWRSCFDDHLGRCRDPVRSSSWCWLHQICRKHLFKINENILHSWFSFLPDGLEEAIVWIFARFVGEGWHLTLGLMFMLIVIFLPGGLVEGGQRIARCLAAKIKMPLTRHLRNKENNEWVSLISKT